VARFRYAHLGHVEIFTRRNNPANERAGRDYFKEGQSMPTKLYVGNLAYSVTNEDLEELFSQEARSIVPS